MGIVATIFPNSHNKLYSVDQYCFIAVALLPFTLNLKGVNDVNGIEVCMAAPRLRDRGFHTKSCKFIFNVVAIFKAFIRNRVTSATYTHETIDELCNSHL